MLHNVRLVDLMSAPDDIKRLVDAFHENIPLYMNYDEAKTRIELINPFFEALGWDVRNLNKKREVVYEDRVTVEGRLKHPDYGFRVGNHTRFFAEAKKPKVDLMRHHEAAYQLRRYGWSAKLPLSVLTDFQDFNVYDCRIPPEKNDTADRALRVRYTYQDYIEKWDEIENYFSRRAVYAGQLETLVEQGTNKGVLEVDEAFLREMDNWRLALAKDIALYNQQLSQRELNMAVQAIIDRIIFLRICEDRAIEPYGRLEQISRSSPVYAELCQLFRQADARYNSGLFHFYKEPRREEPDELTLGLNISDAVLRSIIQRLYYPNSPYDFQFIPADILGQIYERFLGKVIELSSTGEASVTEKPEVRKAGGVYYTPSYVVDYIVEQTVENLLKDKALDQVEKVRILDPACGSGSFLIVAYKAVLDWYLNWYESHAPERHVRQGRLREYVVGDGDKFYALTSQEKKRILLKNIYGVDLDQQAVEVTKLSLLLKVLEGETDATLQPTLIEVDRLLPDLDQNIKWGNSLISVDYYQGTMLQFVDPEALLRLKAFDWLSKTDGFGSVLAEGGFDVIIGNPPYGAEASREQVEYFRRKYHTASTVDSYALFMEASVTLLKQGGYFGMIVPTGWVSAPSMKRLRHIFLDNFQPIAFASMPYDVFGAYIDTVIAIGKRMTPEINTNGFSASIPLVVFPYRYKVRASIDFPAFQKQGDPSLWRDNQESVLLVTLSAEECAIIQKVQQIGAVFANIADIQRGVTPFHTSTIPSEVNAECAFAGTVRRYQLSAASEQEYIRYDETLAEYKPPRYFHGPRLLLRELISRQFRLQAAYTDQNFVTNKSMQSILLTDSQYNLFYLLGLLNSKLLSWYFLAIHSVGRRDDFPKIVLKQTRELPFRRVNFREPYERQLYQQLTEYVQFMLKHQAEMAVVDNREARKTLQNLIEATDREIDKIVYQLYRLSSEEISLIEQH
jgi:predicted type IV restriction endonuclease